MSHTTPSCPFHEWRGCSGTISRRFQDHLRGLEGSTRLVGKQLQSQGEGNQLQTRQMQLQSDLHVGNPTFTSTIRPSRRLLPSREGKDLSAVNPRIVAKILDPHAWIIPIFQPLQSLNFLREMAPPGRGCVVWTFGLVSAPSADAAADLVVGGAGCDSPYEIVFAFALSHGPGTHNRVNCRLKTPCCE